MKELTYYPSLEPMDDTWLKYSLLYASKISSIVPYQRQHLVSDDYLRIADRTKLLDMHNPTDRETVNASIKAIEEVEKFIANPHRRSPIFNSINVLPNWRNPQSWNTRIYREKFTSHWWDFCLENNFGRANDEALLMSNELGFLYMTYLAKEVAQNRGSNLITDQRQFDEFTNFSKVHNIESNSRQAFIKGVVDLSIPRNINSITITELIEFREKHLDKIEAFQFQLELMQSKIENGLTSQKFIDEYNEVKGAFVSVMSELGITLIKIPLTIYLAYNAPTALSMKYTNEAMKAIGVTNSGVYSVKSLLNRNKNNLKVKKLLVELNRI
jgi:hypothetical protein